MPKSKYADLRISTSEFGGADTYKQALDSLGYFSARFDTVSAETVYVFPGRRSRIDSFSIRQLPAPNGFSLEESFPRPYDAGWIADQTERILNHCAWNGYPFAQVGLTLDKQQVDSVLADSVSHNSGIHVIAAVRSGQPARFGGALFAGMDKTRAHILAHDVAFAEGEPFDLRKVHATIDRLRSRSYVQSARAAPPVIIPQKKGDTHDARPGEAIVSAPIEIDDRGGLGVDGAVGLQSQSPGGVALTGDFSLNMLNAFGVGEEASLIYRGEKRLQALEIDVSKPHVFGFPLVAGGGFGLEIQEEEHGSIRGELRILYEIQTRWLAGVSVTAREVTVRDSDAAFRSWRVGGAELVLERTPERLARGVASSELGIRTGTHIAERAKGRHYRWLVRLRAGVHRPTFASQAFRLRVVTGAMGVDIRDSLHAIEKYRIGGRNTVRGYQENQLAFATMGYINSEYLYYFSRRGAVYVFCDGGGGYADRIAWGKASKMLGYGAGIRLPVRIGVVSIAWGRNIDDSRGFGRLHVGFTNAMQRDSW
jgi:outer membrane protein assembly factor BamA